MEEIIIYTAGNPDLYPIEYYDADTETYQGVIPKLLNQFSEQSNYKIKYYNKNSKDERAHLLDVLSLSLLNILKMILLLFLRLSKTVSRYLIGCLFPTPRLSL